MSEKYFTDRLGNVITPGDYIVYGKSAGRSSMTSIGKLLDIETFKPYYGPEQQRLLVMSLQGDKWRMGQSLRASKVRITELHRVLRYHAELVPIAIEELLDAGEVRG